MEAPVVELLDYKKETEKDEDYWDLDLEVDIDMLLHQIKMDVTDLEQKAIDAIDS